MAKYQITEEDRKFIRESLPKNWDASRGGNIEVYCFDSSYPKHKKIRSILLYCYEKDGMPNNIGCGVNISHKKFENLPANTRIPFEDIDFYG